MTLADALPREFTGGEYHDSRAYALRDVEVIEKVDAYRGGRRWPGRHKNVMNWYRLANGNAVGWNENPSVGWSFPVIADPKR